MKSILTLDVGNTNASLAFVAFEEGAAPVVRELGDWARGDDEVEQLGAALGRVPKEHDALRCAGLSAVGARARESELGTRLSEAGYDVIARPVSGLVLEIDSPETCGSDRQYAMRGALELSLAGVKVEGATRVIAVDAGTAVTVDAGELRVAPGGERELVFLGGAIALGPGSLAESISARGARLPGFVPDVDAAALGRSTLGALRSGVSVGFRGAVRELADCVRREAFGESASDGVDGYLTGGARAFARAALQDAFASRLVEVPRLVHVGLAFAAADALEARRHGEEGAGQAGPS